MDAESLALFVGKLDEVEFLATDRHLIVDITFDELELDDWNVPEAEAEWLTGMAPLRSDVLDGDLRLFYLLWLAAVERDLVDPDEAEPLAGLGPLTPQLQSSPNSSTSTATWSPWPPSGHRGRQPCAWCRPPRPARSSSPSASRRRPPG